jgi:pyruvate/2-oxoglutarate dehydrogenase complex dihydrolipoamide dehydrogenase (E3) component
MPVFLPIPDHRCGVACQEGDEPGKLAKVRTDVVIIGGGVIGSE